VDGSIPTVTAVAGSINFNSVYVTFSEPMKLTMLSNPANYQGSGGLTITGAVALDPTKARLLTSQQTGGTRYTVTVNAIEDLAGNAVSGSGSFNGFTLQNGFVGLEIWNNISGGTAQDLRNDPRYPSQPDIDYATTTLNSELVIPSGPNNTYGGRFRAWLTPEETGEYEFFLRCDDGGELRISTDDKFDNLDDPDGIPDAVDSISGDAFQESGFDTSTSLPIALERGRKYAIQMIWKEGNGNDYGQVAWRKVGDATPADQLQPIPSRFFSYYGPDSTPPVESSLTVKFQAGSVSVEWTGGTLQSSDDLRTWKDETAAVSPYTVTPVGTKFYRVRN
jgi:hypothetical protein